MLWLPIRSCFYLYVTWQSTSANRSSVFGRHVEERRLKQSWKFWKRQGWIWCIIDCIFIDSYFLHKKWKRGENYRQQSIFRCRVSRGERRLSKLRKLCKLHTFTFLFSFCYSALSRGHSDTGLYPLPGPATFLTFYFFKRLLISNTNAASSRKQYFQSR